MKLYCTCGGVTEYSLNKPKFCGECGKPFDSVGSVVHTAPKPQQVIIATTEDEPVIPGGIEKIEVEVDFQRPRREKIGDIAGTEAIDVRRPVTVKNKKQAVAKLLQDCAPRTSSTEVNE